jgi:hypothetical protein
MRRTETYAVAGALLAALLALSPAAAQDGRFLVGLQAGVFEPAGFADSYDAVYGETMVPLGLRFEWALGERFALHLQTSFGKADGELVAIVPGVGNVPTGVPTELELNAWHLTAAWRIHPEGPWSGHLGVGPTLVLFDESNELEDVSSDGFGGHAAAGVRRAFGRWAVGAEAIYSLAPDTIGEEGAGGSFDEDDAGGLTAQLFVGYSF